MNEMTTHTTPEEPCLRAVRFVIGQQKHCTVLVGARGKNAFYLSDQAQLLQFHLVTLL